jgi:hypothetical protein
MNIRVGVLVIDLFNEVQFGFLLGGAWNSHHETYRTPPRSRIVWCLREQKISVSPSIDLRIRSPF